VFENRESRIEIMKIDKRDVWGVMRNAGRESEHKSPEYPCKPLFPIYSTRYRLYCTVLYCTYSRYLVQYQVPYVYRYRAFKMAVDDRSAD
jgi:hypothetical protein